MANVSEHENHTTLEKFNSCSNYPNDVQNNTISTLNAILAITAISGNCLVLVALQKVTSLHPSSKLLFSYLASTDLCVGLLLQPLYITYLLTPAHSELCHYFGYVYPILASILCGVSLLTSTAISVDRLLALILGIRYKHAVTSKRIWAFIIASWLGNCVYGIVYIFDDVVPTYVDCVVTLSCVATSTFCYVKIYRTLHHHQSQLDHMKDERPSRRGSPLNIARYRKTVSSALWVSLALVACYLPFIVLTLTAVIANIDTPSFRLFWELSKTLVFFNSSLNPLLYCWKIREVRQAVKNSIRIFLCFLS